MLNARIYYKLRAAGYSPDRALAASVIAKFDPEQPRDEHGRWTSGGGAGGESLGEFKLRPASERAWNGAVIPLNNKISKLEAGQIGEKIALSYMQHLGLQDARPMNSKANNFPVDAMADSSVIEVKTGLVSNSTAAQQWRATIGQPGKKETEWLKTASPEEKAAWNARKQEKILERKKRALKEVSKQLGRPVRGITMGIILDPDRRRADVYRFPGFHLRIGWRSDVAKKGYVGSFEY